MACQGIGPFVQTLFLGASIVQFSSKIGWNTDQGELQVDLVEDPCRDAKLYFNSCGQANLTYLPDRFNPPILGSPVCFIYGSFTYSGILDSWEQGKATSEGTLYHVRVTDPSMILDGTQVIINNYTGQTFGVPNLLNVFGYLESQAGNCPTGDLADLAPALAYTPASGFGSAKVNGQGLTWNQIRGAVQALANDATTRTYGYHLELRDHAYYVDMSEVPPLDNYFRFDGDSISFLDMISQVCRAAGSDFFVELGLRPGSVCNGGGTAGHVTDGINMIKIRTARRYQQKSAATIVDNLTNVPADIRLGYGTIGAFVGTGQGKSSINRGLELRKDTTNAFLVGDNRQDLWQMTYSGDADAYTDTIWPYWGKDSFGYPVRGTGRGRDHTFTISTEGWGRKIGAGEDDLEDILAALQGVAVGTATYTLTVEELLFASETISTWSAYIYAEKRLMANALDADALVHIHANVVAAIGGGFTEAMLPKDFVNAAKSSAADRAALEGRGDNVVGDRLHRLYNIIKSYADSYLGKKFMVALPFVCCAPDEDEPFTLKLNWQKSDSGWTDAAAVLGLTQTSDTLEFFREPDGKISCFVLFTSDKLLDLSELNKEDYYRINDTQIYVKAQFEEIVFLDPLSCSFPRAVITLPGAVRVLENEGVRVWNALIASLLQIEGAVEEATANLAVDALTKQFGNDKLWFGIKKMVVAPVSAAIPLQSTTLSYGPWYSTFAAGPPSKTNYERNTAFSPWGFGSTVIMNEAGGVTVQSQVTNQMAVESGSLSLPGAPTASRLGDVLQPGGPEITNINVNVSKSGVTTAYQLRTWTPNFGELTAQRVNYLRALGTFRQKMQRAFARITSPRNPGGVVQGVMKELTRSDRFNRRSSNDLFVADSVYDYENVAYTRHNVVMTHTIKSLSEMCSDDDAAYQKKAGVEAAGLFRPFSTDRGDNYLPHFVEPSESGINSNILNPFKHNGGAYGTSAGHDIETVIRDTSYPEDGLNIKYGGYATDENSYRSIGHRAPLVLVGWGFDENEKPVPNATPETPGDTFVANWLRKPNLWKAGPLDVRWNEEKGVWVASGGDIHKRVKMNQTLHPGSSGVATVLRWDIEDQTYSNVSPTEEIVIHDPFYRNFLLQDEEVIVVKKRNESDSIWEPLGENGLFRRGTTLEQINMSGSGLVRVEHAFSTGTQNISGHVIWLTTAGVSGSKQVVTQWIPCDRKHVITGAQC